MHSQRAIRRQLQIQDDISLVDTLHPPFTTLSEYPTPTTQTAFITGGTGFLGRYLIRELLYNGTMNLICLVRADNQLAAEQRLHNLLLAIDVSQLLLDTRLQVCVGDVETAFFGMDIEQYHAVATNTQVVYHSAAKVNWVRSYASLRSANVLGTVEVIRFACEVRAKAIVFVSSIAVCYATSLQGDVNESTDLSAHVNNMPLGYAQTKCVAESLLRKMATRGLPIQIIRPALISGDSQTGHSSTSDLIAAVIDGCVTSGVAGDVHWPMDNVAVDYVASVIARIPTKDVRLQNNTLHLWHERPRQWRELVLMLNLFGYRVKLIPMNKWLQSVPGDRTRCGARLYAYRHFFLQTLPSNNQKRVHELYLSPDQHQICSQQSRRWLQASDLHAPPNDALSVRQSIRYWQQQNVLPTLSHHVPTTKNLNTEPTQIAALIRPRIRTKSVSVVDVIPIPLNLHECIFSELLTISGGSTPSLAAWRVLLKNNAVDESHFFDCVVKTRTDDHALIDSCVLVAKLCSLSLGDLVATHSDSLNLSGGSKREQSLYALRIPALRQHTPRSLGVLDCDHIHAHALVLEKLHDIQPHSTKAPCEPWTISDINCVLDGLANIQSIPIESLNTALPPEVLEPSRSKTKTIEMTPLWRELIQFSKQFTHQWQNSLAQEQHQLLDTMSCWLTTEHDKVQVLVHNDFNPRNLILRSIRQDQRLCVYDWELAIIGSPHQDLVEFLIFTVNPNTLTEPALLKLVHQHQRRLKDRGVINISSQTWCAGFCVALRLFMITRLPWYCLMHRFSPQPHLALCSQNASRLLALTADWVEITAKINCDEF